MWLKALFLFQKFSFSNSCVFGKMKILDYFMIAATYVEKMKIRLFYDCTW